MLKKASHSLERVYMLMQIDSNSSRFFRKNSASFWFSADLRTIMASYS
jgi:hypothetical protein